MFANIIISVGVSIHAFGGDINIITQVIKKVKLLILQGRNKKNNRQ